MRTVVEDAETPETPPFWKRAGLFTAWGFAKGTLERADLARRAAAAGFGWVALQTGQHGPEERDAIRAAGLDLVLWGVAPFPAEPGYAATIVQIEKTDQRDTALTLLPKIQTRPAVVTTFGGSDTVALVKPLVALAEVALVECYVEDDPIHADIPRMLDQARRYGWPAAIPVVGLYHGRGLDAYPTLDPTQGFAVWVAEEMAETDWGAIARRLGR